MKKLNDSDAVRVKVGRSSWVTAFELMVFGKDEDGADIAITEGPFRTREIAIGFAKIKFRGYRRSVLVTMVEERFARFKGLPRVTNDRERAIARAARKKPSKPKRA